MKRLILVCCTSMLLTLSLFSNDLVHTIRKGETLYSLSQTYHVGVDDIVRANGISDPSKLSIGMELIIPAVYIVEKGDTYYSLAKKYGVPVETIYRLNNIDESTLLKIGDVLLIPMTEIVAVAVPENPADADAHETPDTAIADGKPFFWPHEGQRSVLEGKLEGLQFEGKDGDTIRSVSHGKVVWVGPYRGYNKIVFVQTFDDYIFGYGGNNDILVKVGDPVEPGTEIGRLGINPHEGKARMFFFVYRNGIAVDPMTAPRQ